MPTVTFTLEDVDKSVVRQSILGIVRDLLEKTDLSSKVATILHGDVKLTTTDHKFNIDANKEPNVPTVATDRRVVVNITTDEYDEDSLYTTAVGQEEYPPIYLDPIATALVWPVYLNVSYVINFAYTTPSDKEAIRWRDNMRAKVSQYQDMYVHDVTYDVIVPEVVENLIMDVYTLRNRLNPQTLVNYFKDNTSRRLHVITDLSGGNSKLAFKEIQTGVQGMFDFGGAPDKPERDDDTNTYTVSFNYKVTINRPSLMTMKYQPMVCNRLMPNKWIQFLVDMNVRNHQEKNKVLMYSKSMFNLSNFLSHRQLEYNYDLDLPINIPKFDEIKTKTVTNGYCVTTTMLTQVDETNKRSLLNLNDLSPYYLDKDFMDWIVEGEHQYVCSPYESVLFFGLNQPGAMYNSPILTVDTSLNVSSTVDLSLLNISRVYLNFIIDLDMLSAAALERLLLRPALFTKFMLEWLTQRRNYPEVRVTCNEDSVLGKIVGLYTDAANMFDIDEFKRLLALTKSTDNLYYLLIMRAIYKNDRSTYDGLLRSGYLAKTETALIAPGSVAYTLAPTNAQAGIMRTVQTSYIVIDSKENLHAGN